MKALVFTDTHHHMPSIRIIAEKIKNEKPEFILCCGDFSIFMNGHENFLEWLNHFKIPCYVIHGNHEDEDDIEKTCNSLNNIYFIHKKIILHGNLLIMGYGGDGFSTKDIKFKSVATKFEKEINKNKEKTKILILHQPPYDSGIDLIYEAFAGNMTTKKFIVKNRINYVFAGHLHENFGLSFEKDGIKYINPGPEGMIFNF